MSKRISEVDMLTIEWIRQNCRPEDIFYDGQLRSWARNQECEYIFGTDILNGWAEANGWIREAG